MMLNKSIGLLSIAFSGMLYGSLALFGRWLIQDGLSISNMLFWRFAMASLTILLLSIKRFHRLTWLNLKSAILNSIIYSLSSWLYFLATDSIGTGLGMVIFYLYPIFIFLFLRTFINQAISKFSWLSLGIVFLGFILLMNQNYTASSEKISLVGVGIALVSSVLYAAYILINKKQALNIDIYFSTFILCLINAVYFFILSHIDGSFGWPGTFRLWGVVFLIGFIATSAPILLMLKGLRTVGADMAALLSVLEPVFTVILGFLFLEEKLHSIQYLGIMVVLLGAMVAAYSNLVRTT